jgi:CDP-diacylglycerol--glycerol-3-phosphate 3-phosphatidyltransferase
LKKYSWLGFHKESGVDREMLTSPSDLQILKILRRKWAFFAAFSTTLWISFFIWLKSWWDDPNPLRWLCVSGLAMIYLLGILWRGLEHNHRLSVKKLLPSLGLGNLLSISRGLILVLFCGFLFSPWPDLGRTAWLPGLLYTLAMLPDFLDGIAARLTDHVTRLGEHLDISLDSLGVLSVSILSVQYGQVPWWYLPVGLARYIFLGGIWIREKFGLPVYDLPFSVRRRGFAGLTMGLFFVILYPVFKPPGTHFAAAIFAIYLLGGFIWDWCLTMGWLPAQPGERYLRLQNIILQYIPLLLRYLLVLWLLAYLVPQLRLNPHSTLLWVETVVDLALILGIAGRVLSIAALVILGIHQAASPLEILQLSLVVLYTNMLFLGTGTLSLWTVENNLIFHRVGDIR